MKRQNDNHPPGPVIRELVRSHLETGVFFFLQNICSLRYGKLVWMELKGIKEFKPKLKETPM